MASRRRRETQSRARARETARARRTGEGDGDESDLSVISRECTMMQSWFGWRVSKREQSHCLVVSTCYNVITVFQKERKKENTVFIVLQCETLAFRIEVVRLSMKPQDTLVICKLHMSNLSPASATLAMTSVLCHFWACLSQLHSLPPGRS